MDIRTNNLRIIYSKASQKDEIAIINLLKNLGGDKSSFNINKFYIAKDEDKLIGCIRIKIFEGGYLELSSLVVDSGHQHKGIGSRLVRELLSKEKRRPIFLLTSSDKENFYKKFNFNIIDPLELPNELKKEYDKITGLPFAKNLQVIVMIIK